VVDLFHVEDDQLEKRLDQMLKESGHKTGYEK